MQSSVTHKSASRTKTPISSRQLPDRTKRQLWTRSLCSLWRGRRAGGCCSGNFSLQPSGVSARVARLTTTSRPRVATPRRFETMQDGDRYGEETIAGITVIWRARLLWLFGDGSSPKRSGTLRG